MSRRDPARIGILTTSYPRRPGDLAGRFVAELAAQLARAGDRPEVLAPHPAVSVDPRVAVTSLRYALSPRLLYGAGAPDNLRSARAWLQAPLFVGRLALACRDASARWDAVLSHWLLPCGLVASRCSRGLPHLAVAHSSDVHLLARWRLAPVALAALARPRTGLVLTSEALRPPLLGAARSPAARRLVSDAPVVRMGIPADCLGPAPAAARALRERHGLVGRTVVLFIGRLVPVKGVDLLLAAAAGLAGIEVVVVGDGPERGRLEQQAARLGVAARFCGELAGEPLSAWRHAADLFVLPSRVLVDGRTDSAPVALLEAMAAALPVVASEVGGNAELLRDEVNGLLVPQGDTAALRAAIGRLAGDPGLRARLGAAARDAAAAHTWERVSGTIRRLLGAL